MLHPEEKVIVPFSLNECPSGNKASQLSKDGRVHHLPDDDFDHYHQALAMSALPKDTHMDLLRTYESIVAVIPPTYWDLGSHLPV